MRFFKILTLALALSCLALTATAENPKNWEQMPSSVALELTENSTVEVAARNGYIYVTVAEPAKVQIFSILGQLVSQKDLKEGTARFKVPTRGIYIIKIGTITRRITI